MRSDMRALVRILAASAVMVLILGALVTTAVLAGVSPEVGAGIGLVGFIVGVWVVITFFSKGLTGRR